MINQPAFQLPERQISAGQCINTILLINKSSLEESSGFVLR